MWIIEEQFERKDCPLSGSSARLRKFYSRTRVLIIEGKEQEEKRKKTTHYVTWNFVFFSFNLIRIDIAYMYINGLRVTGTCERVISPRDVPTESMQSSFSKVPVTPLGRSYSPYLTRKIFFSLIIKACCSQSVHSSTISCEVDTCILRIVLKSKTMNFHGLGFVVAYEKLRSRLHQKVIKTKISSLFLVFFLW